MNSLLKQTIAERLNLRYPGELSALLGMVGHTTTAVRYDYVKEAAELLLKASSIVDINPLPQEVVDAIRTAHTAAARARDLIYVKTIKPILNDALEQAHGDR